MNKKILFIIFCGLLIFLPASKADAMHVYVGVQISSAVAPAYNGGSADTNWCLPSGSQMTILNNTSCEYLENNYSANDVCSYCPSSCLADVVSGSQHVEINSPVCSGNTVWSGLLDIADTASYKIYLYTPNFCSGVASGYCFQKWIAGKNCNEICGHYGMAPIDAGGLCVDDYDSSCSNLEKLKGSSCSGCDSGSYSYYSTSTGACFYNPSYYGSCTWSDPNFVRVCACDGDYFTTTGFNFNFTADF